VSDPENVDGTPEEQEGLHISDKRRFDPETYQRRQPSGADGGQAPAGDEPAGDGTEIEVEVEEGEVPADFVIPDDLSELESDTRVADLEDQVRDRTNDLQRLQAEYVNYKRRVDRDRDVARRSGIETVLTDLIAVLDDLRAAREHEDLGGGFRAVAEEVEKLAAKHGLVAYGEEGEPFDPQIHEALMHQPSAEGVASEGPVVAAVLQPGYRVGDRILRAARVAVAGA
jgi:molecular chaperone GrpE